MAEETFDVVVIGGGATGAGSALDAVVARAVRPRWSRRATSPRGTSSRSSKLIHGGLRYLEQQEFGLVREALRERSLLLNTLAPHLVRAGAVPVSAHASTGSAPTSAPGCCSTTGWAATPGSCAPPPPQQAAARCALAPALKPDSLVGAIQYYDAQVDDARHTLVTARTAAAYGAAVASQAQVVGFLREGERVTGVRVRDNPSGAEIEVRARAWSSTPPACGRTTCSTWSASAASSRSGRPRACTSSSRATACSSTRG